MRFDPHKYGESILLAVSGGVDSVVMAHLASFHKCRLTIAHCNFHLRGLESDDDAAFVQEYADKLGLDVIITNFDTESYAQEHGLSIEMAARELRYRWFDGLCRTGGYDGVCVAHNANDNAETLVLNLLRGTGLNGICGMEEFAKNPYGDSMVFRPLLGFTRAQIEAYARENGLQWRTDSTNLESEVKRNLLRNEVFPLLERINPSVISTLNRDMTNFRDGREAVDCLLDSFAGVRKDDSGMRINVEALRGFRHVRLVLFHLLSPLGFNSSAIQDLASLILNGEDISGRRFLSDRYFIVTTNSEIIVQNASKERYCHIEYQDWEQGMSVKTPRGVILMDADKLGDKPHLRVWEPGDYICPLGLKGKKKISDLLTSLKYNISEKGSALVVEGHGHHVAALVGERIDESVKIDASTKRVVKITLG